MGKKDTKNVGAIRWVARNARSLYRNIPPLRSTSAALRTCLNGGVAFHNSNLKRDEKSVIEKAFRTTDEIRVLVATSTLAAGINTPASVVIIAETEFVGQPRPYTVAEYKNMAGRAGRLGYESEGFSILLSDHATQRDQIFKKYVLGQLEAIQSSFDPNDLDTWIMRLLSQVNQVPRSEVLH
ncbi:MAG: hypothetical protein KC496_07250, partial [Anaerolineae bacterium]|nr:hypothetical protein [Anaerolineae bacterium]